MTAKKHWMTKECLWDRCCASLWCKVSPLIGMNVCVCISNTPLNPLQSLHLNCGAHSWLDRPNNRQYPLLSSLCSRQLWMDLVSKSWQGVGHAWEERGMRKQVFAPYSPRDAELPLWCPVTWKAYENRHTSVIQMLTPGASCCHGGEGAGLWLA